MKEDVQLWVMAWLQELIDGVSGELPSFLEEVVRFGFWVSVFESVVFFGIFLVLGLWAVKFYSKIPESENSFEIPLIWRRLIFSILAGLGLLFFLFCSVNCFEKAMKACMAPRVYVLDKYVLKK